MKLIRNILTICTMAICLCGATLSTAQISTNCPGHIDLCITGEECTTTFLLPRPEWTTTCPQNNLIYNYTGNFGTGVVPLEGVLFTNIGLGDHLINVSTIDECGNSANCIYYLHVFDCNAPTASCINGLTANLVGLLPPADADGDGDMDQAAIQIWGQDFMLDGDSDCSGPIRYSVHLSEAVAAGTDVPDPDHPSLVLTCDHLGANSIRVYAWDDAFNPYAVQPDGSVGGPNYDWCETTVEVQDVLNNACSGNGSSMTVSGTIQTPWGAPLPGALVEISNGLQTHVLTTDDQGRYALELPSGEYSVRPYSDNSDYTNGVDSIDLILIRVHMLSVPNLDNPYKILAADVNLNQSISTFDLVLISNVILGIAPSFPAPSWQFVDAAYNFPVPQNPFFEPVPGIVHVNAANAEANFVGFKSGDVNWDASSLTGVEGTVYQSETGDCVIDVDNPRMDRWVVTAKKVGEDRTFYSITNDLGAYRLSMVPGDYLVSLQPLTENWGVCNPEIPVTVGATSYQILNLSAKSVYDCPVLFVEIGAPFLRQCFENPLSINFANNGSVTAENAYVEVTFDNFLEVTGSTIPWSGVSGNTYTFPLGDIAPGQHGYFGVTAMVSCAAVLGQTHCAEARIYPDTICLPTPGLWDGSDLKLSSQCDGDTLRFLIENQGNDMQQPSPYYVVVDDMIMMTDEVDLPAGGIKEITRKTDGATIRVVVQQTPGHPGLGTPTLAVEGCGVNEFGGFSTGFVTQFPENEADPNISIYCSESIDSFDPNDKQAFPKGVDEPHYIEPGQELEYLIRFQNTGTDTAYAIVIHDTLSASLNPATLQTGASSHPCTWQLRSDGILSISFSEIGLPGSASNEPASHGFVSFRIRPQEGLESPTVITNQASIYFDVNDPVITNEVFHTIDTNFLGMVNSEWEVFKPAPQLKLSPNPLQAGSPFQIEGALSENCLLILYSNTGRQMATLRVQEGGMATLPAGTPAGWYLLELRSENQIIGRGKVVVGRN